MDNYAIMHCIDANFIQQNSWHIILEKQVGRNAYLLKKYSQKTKNKFCLKDAIVRIRDLMNKAISMKAKNRKNSEKLNFKTENLITNTRKKTEESNKKLT